MLVRSTIGVAFAAAVAMLAAGACSSRNGLFGAPVTGAEGGAPSTGGTGGGGGMTVAPHADKVDLLLLVDNSASMGEKHAILADTLPALLGAFVDPPCATAAGA